MAEVLVTYSEPLTTADGTVFHARACGREIVDGRWEGWIEFEPVGGTEVLRSGRETMQPNRDDAAYWATGLTPVYLEGALTRAMEPRVPATRRRRDPPLRVVGRSGRASTP